MTPGEAAFMKHSSGFARAAASRRLRRSVSSGFASLMPISPVQHGRVYCAVAPLSASFFSRFGKSTRSCPGWRGESPENPLRRSFIYVA
jgi:hypothetical protein